MSEKKCECEVCTCGGRSRLFIGWLSNGTKRSGRVIKLAAKEYIEAADFDEMGENDLVKRFYNKYCIGTFKLNDKSTYSLSLEKDGRIIPIKFNEEKSKAPKKSFVSHISKEGILDARSIIPPDKLAKLDAAYTELENALKEGGLNE